MLQVAVCSFVYGGSKPKTTKQGETTAKEDEDSEAQSSDKLGSPGSEPLNQSYNVSATGMWPVDVKSAHPHTGIDLMRG